MDSSIKINMAPPFKSTATKDMGPSIYDVHTKGGGGQAQVDGGVQPHVDVHTEN